MKVKEAPAQVEKRVDVRIELPEKWSFGNIFPLKEGGFNYSWPEDVKELWKMHLDRCPGSLYGYFAGSVVREIVERSKVKEWLGIKGPGDLKKLQFLIKSPMKGSCPVDGLRHALGVEADLLAEGEGRVFIARNPFKGTEIELTVKPRVLAAVAGSDLWKAWAVWEEAGKPKEEGNQYWEAFRKAAEEASAAIINIPPNEFFEVQLKEVALWALK